jgi:hypothetical protein
MRSIIWSIVIGFFISIGGSYLKHHFALLGILLLGIAGILIGGAVMALRNCNKVGEARRVPIRQNVPLITSGWDYRPKEANRRFAHDQSAGMETADLLTPSVAEDKSDNVWFDDRWLEFGTHAFDSLGGVRATAANEPIKPSLSDPERAVAAYD